MVIAATWRWDEASFIRAWEAGLFGDQRVELVEEQVWPVAIGPWHASVAANIARALPDDAWRVTLATLPAAGSLPDPDVWVHRRQARPVARLGHTGRLARWSPTDIGLVFEVGDTTFAADTEVNARIYGAAGYPIYWVVHRGGVEVFDDPYEGGYRQRRHVPTDAEHEVPYAPLRLRVATVLDADD